jgi:hypothetical protein
MDKRSIHNPNPTYGAAHVKSIQSDAVTASSVEQCKRKQVECDKITEQKGQTARTFDDVTKRYVSCIK